MEIRYKQVGDKVLLAADNDVDVIVHAGEELPVQAVWDTFDYCSHLRSALDRVPDNDEPSAGNPDVVNRDIRAILIGDLNGFATVAPTQALAANARLVELLVGRRWSVMRDAREAGDSWTVIGEALGMTKQRALDWYKRTIADQQKYAPQFHDADRARAAIREQNGATG